MNCPLNISFLSNDLWKVYLRWEGQMMLWEKSYTEFISPLHVSSGKLPWSCRPGEKRTVWSEKSPLPSCECLHFVFFFFCLSLFVAHPDAHAFYLLFIHLYWLFFFFLYAYRWLYAFALCFLALETLEPDLRKAVGRQK